MISYQRKAITYNKLYKNHISKFKIEKEIILYFKGEEGLKIGNIYGVSSQHIIVVPQVWENRFKLPKLGTSVVDSELVNLGTIVDIFGPTKKPFFSIKAPRSENLASFSSRVGEPVYTASSSSSSSSKNKTSTKRYLINSGKMKGSKTKRNTHQKTYDEKRFKKKNKEYKSVTDRERKQPRAKETKDKRNSHS